PAGAGRRELASAVITSFGFNRTTIYKWLIAAAKPGVGLRALQARPGIVTETGFDRVARQGRIPAWISLPIADIASRRRSSSTRSGFISGSPELPRRGGATGRARLGGFL